MVIENDAPRPIHRLRRVWYNTYANLPTSGNRRGDLGFATDRLVLYRWSGSAWQEITIHVSSGVTANIPSASDLPESSLYYETDTGRTKQVQSGAWTVISSSNTDAWVASDDLQQSADTERNTSSGTPVKLKEIQLDEDCEEIRVKFDLDEEWDTGQNAYGRIYLNGAAHGTLQSTGSQSFVTFSEDLDNSGAGYSNGDLIQLYVWHQQPNRANCRNFRIYANRSFVEMNCHTLSTPIGTTETLLTTVNTD